MGRTKGGEKDYSFGNNVIYVFIILYTFVTHTLP